MEQHSGEIFIDDKRITCTKIIQCIRQDRIGEVVVERPPRMRGVAGSIPALIILKTLKLVEMAALKIIETGVKNIDQSKA